MGNTINQWRRAVGHKGGGGSGFGGTVIDMYECFPSISIAPFLLLAILVSSLAWFTYQSGIVTTVIESILLFRFAADALRRMLLYWEYYCPPILHMAIKYPSQTLLFLITTVSTPFVIASWWLFDCFIMMSWWLFHLVKCVKRIMGSFIRNVTTPPKCQSQSRRRSCFTSPAFIIIRLFFMWILCAQSVSAMESSVSRGLGISSSEDLAVVDITNALENSGLKRKERDDNSIGSSGSDDGKRREEELDKIFKGWGDKDVINAMKAFLLSSDDDLSNGCGIKLLIRDYLVGLLDSNDASTLKSAFEKKQNELGKKIDSVKLGDKVIKSRTKNDEHKKGVDGNEKTWQHNFGEGLDDDTEGVAYANYAPTSDSNLQDEKHCRIPRLNSCMQKFSKVRTLPCVVCCFLVLFYILTNLYTYLCIC